MIPSSLRTTPLILPANSRFGRSDKSSFALKTAVSPAFHFELDLRISSLSPFRQSLASTVADPVTMLVLTGAIYCLFLSKVIRPKKSMLRSFPSPLNSPLRRYCRPGSTGINFRLITVAGESMYPHTFPSSFLNPTFPDHSFFSTSGSLFHARRFFSSAAVVTMQENVTAESKIPETIFFNLPITLYFMMIFRI